MLTFNEGLFEIFSWMPATFLCKSASVCKSFLELLFDDFFVKTQCKHMQLYGDTDFFVEGNCIQRYSNSNLVVHVANFSGKKTSGGLPQKSVDFLVRTGRILASSNGLLCCRNTSDRGNSLFIFNPTTRSLLSIPSPHEENTDASIDIVFECENNEDSNDYFLMSIVSPDEWGAQFCTKIYSHQERVWRDGARIDLGSRNMDFENSIYLNGVVYLVSDHYHYLSKASAFYWPYVVAYETKSSISKFLAIPREARKGLQHSKLGLFKWHSRRDSLEKTICLVRLLKNAFTVWVLMGYDRHTGSSYWWRYFKMRVKAMKLPNASINDDLKVIGFTVVNGSVLLFATREKVYSYDITTGVAKLECMHEFRDFHVCFTSISSTLRRA